MASYDNINKITCYNYIKNINLRNKTKDFLLKELFLNEKEFNENRINFGIIINNKSTIYENNYNLKNKSKVKKESINKSVIVTGKRRGSIKKINRRSSMPNFNHLRKRGTSNTLKIFKKSEIKGKYLDVPPTNFISERRYCDNKNSSMIVLMLLNLIF